MSTPTQKATNLHAIHLKNSLYKLHNQMKVERKEFEIYTNKNKITMIPTKTEWEIHIRDKHIGTYKDHVIFSLILEACLKPRAVMKASEDLYRAMIFEDLLATLATKYK